MKELTGTRESKHVCKEVSLKQFTADSSYSCGTDTYTAAAARIVALPSLNKSSDKLKAVQFIAHYVRLSVHCFKLMPWLWRPHWASSLT